MRKAHGHRPGGPQAGISALETLIALVIGVGILTLVLHLVEASQKLSEASRLRAMAAETLRRNLETTVNLLRGAAPDSLDGFAADGTSSAPWFKRLDGQSGGTPQHGVEEQLVWRPAPQPVPGVAAPGRVMAVDENGAEWLVADRVPQGGFSVVRQGSTLLVRLRVYATDENGDIFQLTGRTAVFMRN